MVLLQEALTAGRFAITAEVTPPRGGDAGRALAAASALRGLVHAVNVTDGSRAVMRMSSLAMCKLLLVILDLILTNRFNQLVSHICAGAAVDPNVMKLERYARHFFSAASASNCTSTG